jgi:creatinine amidohydrolase
VSAPGRELVVQEKTHMQPSMILLEELTTTEIRSLINHGWDTVIVPLGSTEQHGPALPLNVDALHGLHTALRAAEIMGKVLVGPVVTLGYSPEHSSFAGTVSVSKETLRGIIHDIAESHARSGFKLVYFWIGHGGDNAVLQDVLPELENKWPGCSIAGIADLEAYIAATWDRVPLELGMDLERSGSHAGEFETSMMLAVRPDLVRMDEAEEGNLSPFASLCDKMMAEGIHSVSPNGVLGDQRAGDRERGDVYLSRLAEYLVTDLTRERKRVGGRGA